MTITDTDRRERSLAAQAAASTTRVNVTPPGVAPPGGGGVALESFRLDHEDNEDDICISEDLETVHEKAFELAGAIGRGAALPEATTWQIGPARVLHGRARVLQGPARVLQGPRPSAGS